MSDCRVVILTAVMPEARVIAAGLKMKKDGAGVPFWRRGEISLVNVGMRCIDLAQLQKIVFAKEGAGVLMVGLAGGLDPALRAGDVVTDGPLPSGIRGTEGGIYTATKVMGTPLEKKQIFLETKCIAVDMETSVARAYAAKLGVRFQAVRAISDAADQALDPAFLRLVDVRGRVRVMSVLGVLCRHPGKLRALLTLKRDSEVALANLSRAVAQFIDAGWPQTGASSHP